MDHVLYYAANPARTALRITEDSLDAAARRLSPLRARQVRIGYETSVVRTLAKLRSGGADALVIDARGESGGADESSCIGLLHALFEEHEVAGVIGRDRTWLVVDPDERGAALAFEAGRSRLAGVVSAMREPDLWGSIWEHIVSTVSRKRGGKIAICLAGGGIEGLFYELGALRAVQRFLPEYSLAQADIICGISAGAVLAGLLANGLGPDDIEQGLRGKTNRINPIRRSDLFDPAIGTLARRAVSLSWDVVRGRRSPLSALFRLPPAGMFSGKRLERWLATQFAMPGMTDRFDELPHKLFIGATDQDTSEHVLFGSPSAPNVPIHRAIRASTALAPFYAPEKIGDRYYIDGGFTRTTNLRVAAQEGATLVLLVDPLVPVNSPRPGHVAERGAVFTAMQGLKQLINGRFDKAVPTLKAMYPHVSFHLFQPGEAARRVMGGSPMKYFFREEIEEISFRETVREIRGLRTGQLERDFERHGVLFADPDAPNSDLEEDRETELRVVA